jgi:hypothetical protein
VLYSLCGWFGLGVYNYKGVTGFKGGGGGRRGRLEEEEQDVGLEKLKAKVLGDGFDGASVKSLKGDCLIVSS